jgi:hypothetical protein
MSLFILSSPGTCPAGTVCLNVCWLPMGLLKDRLRAQRKDTSRPSGKQRYGKSMQADLRIRCCLSSVEICRAELGNACSNFPPDKMDFELQYFYELYIAEIIQHRALNTRQQHNTFHFLKLAAVTYSTTHSNCRAEFTGVSSMLQNWKINAHLVAYALCPFKFTH